MDHMELYRKARNGDGEDYRKRQEGKRMKYRKKPVVVEAEVYKPGLEDGFDKFCIWYEELFINNHDCGTCNSYRECRGNNMIEYPYINTLEGKHYISPDDYIITGVKGERYPCKPDIFEMTYEAVEEE